MSVGMDLEIPNDLQDELDGLFPESTERRQIASILMFWNKKPTTKEAGTIGKAVGRSKSTVNDVVGILIDNGYFSKDLGSMPLYRYVNKKAGLSLTDPQSKQLDQLDHPTNDKDLETEEEDLEEGKDFKPSNGDDEESSKFTGPFPGVPKEVSDLLTTQQKEIEGIQRTMDTKFDELTELITRGRTHALNVAPAELNPSDSNPVIQAENLGQIDQSGSVEDRLERIEQLVQERGEQDPFADLDRDQILELIRSQPKEFMAMVNPDGAGRTDRVEAQAVTLRPMILMLTTYSQMLYERVVYDGYFEGTLSDFANFTIEQYFTDRGWSLDWNKREPASRRRRLG